MVPSWTSCISRPWGTCPADWVEPTGLVPTEFRIKVKKTSIVVDLVPRVPFALEGLRSQGRRRVVSTRAVCSNRFVHSVSGAILDFASIPTNASTGRLSPVQPLVASMVEDFSIKFVSLEPGKTRARVPIRMFVSTAHSRAAPRPVAMEAPSTNSA